MIGIVACIQKGGGIGYKGKLIYHNQKDLARFKQITMGENVVMGRKTWESLGEKPLEGRTNIIVSRNPDAVKKYDEDGVFAFQYPDFFNVYQLAKMEDVYIIGGESLYNEFVPNADWLFLTFVEGHKNANTFFPIEELEKFNLISSEVDGEYEFRVYKRKNG